MLFAPAWLSASASRVRVSTAARRAANAPGRRLIPHPGADGTRRPRPRPTAAAASTRTAARPGPATDAERTPSRRRRTRRPARRPAPRPDPHRRGQQHPPARPVAAHVGAPDDPDQLRPRRPRRRARAPTRRRRRLPRQYGMSGQAVSQLQHTTPAGTTSSVVYRRSFDKARWPPSGSSNRTTREPPALTLRRLRRGRPTTRSCTTWAWTLIRESRPEGNRE